MYQRLRCIAIFQGHTQNISSVNFAPKKGFMFVSASADNTLKVWDIKKWTQAEAWDNEPELVNQASMTVMAHQKCVNIAKFSPNDKFIASGSQDKTVKIFTAKELRQVMELKGHMKGVWDLEFSPADKQIATVSGDKLLKVWNIGGEKAECVATL